MGWLVGILVVLFLAAGVIVALSLCRIAGEEDDDEEQMRWLREYEEKRRKKRRKDRKRNRGRMQKNSADAD